MGTESETENGRTIPWCIGSARHLQIWTSEDLEVFISYKNVNIKIRIFGLKHYIFGRILLNDLLFPIQKI